MTAYKPLVGIILAAGESTRMKSETTPKVLQPVMGHPMLDYVVNAAKESGVERVVVVIGHKGERVAQVFQGSGVEFVTQKERLGTGHAVLQTAPYLEGIECDCLILCGDTPLITPQTLQGFCQRHRSEKAALTLLTALVEHPRGYGRILRDDQNKVMGIVEERDATEEQRKIREINAGIYCFDSGVLFSLLQRVGRNNSQGEYYLTDCIALAKGDRLAVSDYVLQDPMEIHGVNSRAELARVAALLRRKKLDALMMDGVSIIDPETTYIDQDVSIGQDSIVYPCVVIEGRTRIGKGCVVRPFTYIKDKVLGDGETVGKGP